jgi:integrase
MKQENKIEGINEKYLIKHLRYCELEGLSPRRKKDVFIRMRNILINYIPNKKDFFELDKKEYEDITIKLQKNLKSYYSIKSYIATIRKFIRVNLDLESSDSLPKKYSSLKAPRQKGKYKLFKGADEMLSLKEVIEASKRAKNYRDAAALMLLFEGLRPHELLKLRYNDIKKNELNYWYADISSNTKTGARRIRLIISIPAVQDYIETINQEGNLRLFNFSSEYLIKLIKGLCSRTPYILRHSAITLWSQDLTESELSERFGWIIGTAQMKVYIHLSQKQLDRSIDRALNKISGEREQTDMEKYQPKICMTCRKYNIYKRDICDRCQRPLNLNEMDKREKLDKISYKCAEKLHKINPDIFEGICNSFGIRLESK